MFLNGGGPHGPASPLTGHRWLLGQGPVGVRARSMVGGAPSHRLRERSLHPAAPLVKPPPAASPPASSRALQHRMATSDLVEARTARVAQLGDDQRARACPRRCGGGRSPGTSLAGSGAMLTWNRSAKARAWLLRQVPSASSARRAPCNAARRSTLRGSGRRASRSAGARPRPRAYQRRSRCRAFHLLGRRVDADVMPGGELRSQPLAHLVLRDQEPPGGGRSPPPPRDDGGGLTASGATSQCLPSAANHRATSDRPHIRQACGRFTRPAVIRRPLRAQACPRLREPPALRGISRRCRVLGGVRVAMPGGLVSDARPAANARSRAAP